LHADLLFAHGQIVTMDADRRILEDGAVAVSDGRIVAVGTWQDVSADWQVDEVIDCRGQVVLPGLIDAHGHGGHSLIKSLGSDSPSVWMRIVTPAYFHDTTPAFWHADGLLSAVERLRSGVTCGVSVLGSRPRSDDPAIGIEHARAYEQVGIREMVAVGPSGLPLPHPVSRWVDGKRVPAEASLEEMLEGAEAVIETCHGSGAGRIRVYLTPFTIVPSIDPSNPTPNDQATALTADDRILARRVREVAAKWGVRIHSDAFGGMVRMAAQDLDIALLGPDVHLQHCVGLSLDEVAILAETGTGIGHAPGGKAPVAAMLEAGLRIAITTDGHARRSYDLFQAARAAQFAQRLMSGDSYLLPPGRLLEMITIEAAQVIGCDDEIGSLEVGKRADAIAVDVRQAHLTPWLMPAHQLIYGAVGQDVSTVVVDGKVLMRNRRILSVDVESVLQEAEQQSSAFIERAGIQAHLTSPGWRQNRTTFDRPVPLPHLAG
jgi:5-methylthioadenosine/S-adenosylhomocysteine deaminase